MRPEGKKVNTPAVDGTGKREKKNNIYKGRKETNPTAQSKRKSPEGRGVFMSPGGDQKERI